jgi:hypothetical protein
MQFDLDKSIELLAQTPRVLDSVLRDRSPEWLNCRESPNAFSPTDVLGHLILADETDWLPRARMILQDQRHTPFPPFNRFDFQRILSGKAVDRLLDEFAALRARNLQVLAAFHLTEAQLDLRGTHPDLGSVTLQNLLATWVVHDLNHIQQIVKTLSNEYREAVGPWQAYLGILQ